MRKEFATIFALRGEAFGLPDPAIDFRSSLEFVAADQRRWKKLVARSKLAYTSHFVLTTLGSHWSLDMMYSLIVIVYLVLVFLLISLGKMRSVKAPHPVVAGVLLSLLLLPDLFHTRRISMDFDGPLTTT